MGQGIGSFGRCVGLVLAAWWWLLCGAAQAEGWQRHQLGAYGFAVPADWAETARRADEIDFASPDGRYALWARLWVPDAPLLGYADIASHGTLTIAGQTALFIHSETPVERVLQYAFDPPDTSGRQFLFQLIANSVPLADHQRLFQLLGGQLVVAGVPAIPAAATPAPTAPAPAAVPGAGAALLALARSRYGADCAEVAVQGWRHDTRAVLEASGAAIRFLALCRGKTWPVFGVDLPYDPRLGGNDGFFHPFYAQMFRANGGWDFALVDPGFGAIVEVRGRGRDSLSIDIHDGPAP